MYKLVYFVPASHLDQTKAALFDAGGGRVGDYECCAWQCEGEGQFRPLAAANPFIGERGALEVVREFRVELVCEDHCIERVVEALRQAHPYEEPAFDVTRLEVF